MKHSTSPKSMAVATASVLALTAALSACGSSDSGDSSTSAGGPAATNASGKQDVTFWGWAPGYKEAVAAYNASQDKVTVTFESIQPGAKGGYEKMLNAAKAGNAPCLGQVGYETLTSFAANGALTDVTQQASPAKGEFNPAAWQSVTIADKVYGAPVDQGPMVMFYNKKVLDSIGAKPPTTWAEYEKLGETLKAKKPTTKLTAGYSNYDYAGFPWQAGASWFGTEGDAWKVSVDSPANTKVAAYWDGLVKKDLVHKAPMYDQAWNTALGDGSIATVVGAVWQAGVIKGVAAGKGRWAVAPMPQWAAGENKVGNVGGSATAVLKGCKNTDAAWDFAHWMSTDAKAFGTLVDKAGLYPAATKLQDLPQLTAPDPYFSNQKVFDVVKAAAPHVTTGWTWGPMMPETTKSLDDGLGKAWVGQGTVAAALKGAQTKSVDTMKSQGLSVK